MQILARIDADMRSHRAKEQMARRSQICDAHALALQLGEAARGVVNEQLEAADMHAAEHRQVYAAIQPGDEHRGVPKVDSAENSQILRVRVAGRRLQSVAAPYPGVWWGSLASSARASSRMLQRAGQTERRLWVEPCRWQEGPRRSARGASRSSPRVPAKVASPSDLPTF